MTGFGGVTATIHFGSHKVHWPVYVAPIRESILIGVDVRKSLDVVIFAGEENHQIGKEVIAGRLRHGGLNSTANCSAVLVDENCWLPPESERVIIGCVQTPHAGALAVLQQMKRSQPIWRNS
jgi:hypothetical protein